MARLYLGIGLLVALLVLGLWVAGSMDDLHSPIVKNLEQAAQLCLSGDFKEGAKLAQKAHGRWAGNWRRIAAVSDHTPMDEIDGLFAQAEFYAQSGNATEFAAHCARLAQRIEAVSDAQRLTWWNLL